MIFSLDVETLIHNKGDPFDSRNSMVLGAFGTDKLYSTFLSTDVSNVVKAISSAKMVALFNAKFDLHWLRRCGVNFSIRLPIWDCQLAEFFLSNQRWKYPSLNESCKKRGLEEKLDVVKLEYWDKGIDTDQIPFDILNKYLRQDISSTYQLYLAQVEEFKKPEHASKYKVFRMACYDLLVLEEMEYNGFLFDCAAAREESKRLEKESAGYDANVYAEFPDVPINLGSPNHISCMLYGGTITAIDKIPIGYYKSGAREGLPRYQNVEVKYELPRLIEPLRGSEQAKEGYFSTNEDVLKNLKGTGKVKRIVQSLLDRRGVEKLRSTYYDGIPNLMEEHHWENNIIHGQFNQCVALTGRLSATKPNSQNLPPGCKRFCISRYDT